MRANGKICHVEMPSADVDQSARFYGNVFGWKTRRRGDGTTAFDDGVEVSGTNGGQIVERSKPDAREKVARFRDPAGNVLGLYQDR